MSPLFFWITLLMFVTSLCPYIAYRLEGARPLSEAVVAVSLIFIWVLVTLVVGVLAGIKRKFVSRVIWSPAGSWV